MEGADAAVTLAPGRIVSLSEREVEVLRLVAAGHSNAEIAQALAISVRTVERHLQNTYEKLGLRGKSARAGAVSRLLATT